MQDGADNQIILAGKAEDSAPGSSPVTKAIGPYSVPPLLYAEALHGSAIANQGDCVLGSDASRGRGFAADAELIDTGSVRPDGRLGMPVIATEQTNPERAVISSVSRTRFVAQTDSSGRTLGTNAGLMSEVRETIAPIRLLADTPAEIDVEVLGEWVLQTVATGEPNGSWIHYGPENVSPETRVIVVKVGGNTIASLTTQQFLGGTGEQITIQGLAEVTIGEPPRAIGGDYLSSPTDSADGTAAAAAVDVVRVKLAPSSGLADVRVGHMEASARVPFGGIACPLPVTKTSDKTSVPVGDSFLTNIAVTNPYGCSLSDLKLTDAVSVKDAATFDVASADRGAFTGGGTKSDGAWALGDLASGATASRAPSFSATAGPGLINDTAVATALCSTLAANGTTSVNVKVTGQSSSTTGAAATNTASVVVKGATKVLGKKLTKLAATGQKVPLLPGFALMLIGANLVAMEAVRRRALKRSH
ncbi:MAG: hypothetical protein ACYDCC_13765 [Actinomycetota bacterium]